jgi:hypothetical protein
LPPPNLLSARDLPHRHAIAGTGPAELEDLIMATFLFTYRRPENYTPGRPAAIAAWSAWFESMGANVAERGNPVYDSGTLGNCGAGTRLAGYSVVTGDDLEEAVALARRCPVLGEGGGVEVGEITVVNPSDRLTAREAAE